MKLKTLKKELCSNITAVDISKEALEVALKNAKNNHVEIEFLEGNLLESQYIEQVLLLVNVSLPL